MKSARQPAAEPTGEMAGLEAARHRLDEAIARLERETLARIERIRSDAKADAGTRVAALETEIATLKSEKRELERANAELRKAAESAGGRVEQAIASVRALLGEGDTRG